MYLRRCPETSLGKFSDGFGPCFTDISPGRFGPRLRYDKSTMLSATRATRACREPLPIIAPARKYYQVVGTYSKLDEDSARCYTSPL